MRRRATVEAWLLALLAALLTAALLLASACTMTTGWRQPSDVMLLCPGVDPVRLWPWPPALHWYEEGHGQEA